MADVFVSYKREDATKVRPLVEALRDAGLSTWWDEDIAPSDPWESTIEKALGEANAVVVCWSPEAAQSENVRSEARLARNKGRLIQVFLKPCEAPLFFGERQGVDLSNWRGRPNDSRIAQIVESVRALAGHRPERGETRAWDPFMRSARIEHAQPLIAVLAFECQSDLAGSEWFAEGVSEEILLNVSRIDGVRTIARSSSFQLTAENRSAAAVAQQLGASHVLDGSVRRQDNRVRILAQLCTVPDGATVWCDSFDGTLTDLFAVQDAVARATAAALRRRFNPRDPIARVSPRAYDLYLQGRQISGSEDCREECISLYRSAVEVDPDFVDAWASLSLSLAYAARFDAKAKPFERYAKQAREAAVRALAIDPHATNAHHALSLLEPFAHYSVRERYLESARAGHELNPESLRMFGDFAYTVGRMREGIEFFEESWKLDPLNRPAVNAHCSALFHQGLKKESYEAYRFAREKWPDDWRFLFMPLLIAANNSDWEEVDELLAQPGIDRPELAIAVRAASALRDPNAEVRQRNLAAAEDALATHGRVDPAWLNFLHAIGLRDEAFDLAERSNYDNLFNSHGHGRGSAGFPSGVIFSQAAQPMREDPRFLTLCARLGLCTYWIGSGRWPDCADEVQYDFRTTARQQVQP